MNNQAALLTSTFIEEIKRRLFEECVPRLKRCLDELSVEQIWWRPNQHSNSLGNLVLHLNGNVRQWVVAGLGENEDVRKRQLEFDEKGPVSNEKMLGDLDALMAEVATILDNVKAEDLTKKYLVQGYQESGISILVHVTEHYSYHVGQMTYIVKMVKDMDLGYYAGHDLDTTNTL
jgi:uncharacterized damage-inducible protein DinB